MASKYLNCELLICEKRQMIFLIIKKVYCYERLSYFTTEVIWNTLPLIHNEHILLCACKSHIPMTYFKILFSTDQELANNSMTHL